MPLPKVLEHVKQRPSMYLNATDFDSAVALIIGYNLATPGGLLVGFREWLITRIGGGNNLAWPGLALMLAFPDTNQPGKQLSRKGNQEKAFHLMFQLLEEFWNERESDQGLHGIYFRYHEWLSRQKWYRPGSPGWIPKASTKHRTSAGART
jgi:hypothetical protein